MATIDERLEAIAQSTEMLVQAQLKTEDSIHGLTLAMKALAQAHVEIAKAHLQHEDAINRLALIAASHDDRLDALEGEE
jgi:hypothetical protein